MALIKELQLFSVSLTFFRDEILLFAECQRSHWHYTLCPQLVYHTTEKNRVIGFVKLAERDRILAAAKAICGGSTKMSMLTASRSDPLPNTALHCYFEFEQTAHDGRPIANVNKFVPWVPFGMSTFPNEVDREKIAD